jgi:hypothetical protein
MKRKFIFGVILFALFALQAQAVIAQATPVLRSGIYTDSSVAGSELSLVIIGGTSGTATHRIRNVTDSSSGSISISGNQLVINWQNGPLKGLRSVYTINSSNQFSGSGEVWRMGF